ncbi:hypothetical protein ALC56_01524 [Trachymyrmex septentrionalis]|uniref:Uncharacterized protein n=1 Tax=Trachymyrmex septentrionalis TaxID=34720 RepID=A0A195FU84_9HYME|nr:hypothetical protein ALC56_01524 [Trachymyrmex septentrionalis]
MEGERECEYGSERNPLSQSQKSVVRKKSANARLPLSCEVRGRRREFARPLTPVSGVAAGVIRSKRNGENPIEESRDRAGEERTQVPGEREERDDARAKERVRERIVKKKEKEKNRKTCARREKHGKHRLRLKGHKDSDDLRAQLRKMRRTRR